MRVCGLILLFLLGGCAIDSQIPMSESSPSIAPDIAAGEVSHKSSYNSLTETPVLSWTESNSEDIFSYAVAVGSTPGADDVYSWTNMINLPTSLSFLTLTPGQTYYISGRAITSAGEQSEVFSSSDGWSIRLILSLPP